MKILNLREYDCCPYTSLFLGTEMSPNVFEMLALLREHMSGFNAIKSVHDDYIQYRESRFSELVRDEVVKFLNANGYFEFTPKEIAIGD